MPKTGISLEMSKAISKKRGRLKLTIAFLGIVALMLGWAVLALRWPGAKPPIIYVYVPVVVATVIGAAVYGCWSRNSN